MLLVLLIAILKINSLLHPQLEVQDLNKYPLSSVVKNLVQFSALPVSVVMLALSFVLIFLQCILINNTVNELKLLPQNSYLPAFAFAISSNLFQEFSIFEPQLIANTFLIIAMASVFKFYMREKFFGQIFNTGFIIAVAALFYFPYIIFAAFLLLGLMLMRPFNWREWMVAMFGLIIPFYLAGTYLYVTNQLQFWISRFVFSIQIPNEFLTLSHADFYVPVIISTLIIVWSVLNVQQNFFKMLVQTRLCFILLLWFFLIGLFIIFTEGKLNISLLSWSAIPASIGLAYFFYEFKKQKLAELIALSLLLTLLFFQYKPYLIS